MAITIKSPSDFPGNGPGTKPTGGGVMNGVDGYQKRTPSPNGVPEKIFNKAMPKSNLDIKTPATTSNGRK